MYWLNTPDKILQEWTTLEWLPTKYTRIKPSHSQMKNWTKPSNTPCSWATKTEIIYNVSWSILKYQLILLLGLWSKYTIWLWEREKVLTNNTSYRKESQIWRPRSENSKKLSIPTSQKIILQTNWYIIIDWRRESQSYGSADVFYSENNRNNKSLNVCNGKPTNYYLSWEESKIPTFSLEIILTTAVIHAHEECD